MLNIPVLINVPGYAAFNEEANEQQVIEETFIDAIFLHWGVSTKMFDDKIFQQTYAYCMDDTGKIFECFPSQMVVKNPEYLNEYLKQMNA